MFTRTNHLKNMWEEWLDSGKMEFTKSGKRNRASYEMVASWIHQAWKLVASQDMVLDGFRKCGYIEYDGNIKHVHSKLRETIERGVVPREVIEEFDALIAEFEAEDESSEQEGELEGELAEEEDDRSE